MTESVLAEINTLNAPFWDGARQGKLVLPYCNLTQKSFWPPSPISPYAEKSEVSWKEVEPSGVLLARVVFRRAFVPEFAHRVPYGIGLIELDAGPRLQVHIHTPGEKGAPAHGDRVVLAFEPNENSNVPLLVASKLGDGQQTGDLS